MAGWTVSFLQTLVHWPRRTLYYELTSPYCTLPTLHCTYLCPRRYLHHRRYFIPLLLDATKPYKDVVYGG